MVKRKFKNLGISFAFAITGSCCLLVFKMALSVGMIPEAILQLLVAIGCMTAAIKIFYQSNIR